MAYCVDGEHDTDERTEHLRTCRCGETVCLQCGNWKAEEPPFCPGCLASIGKEIEDIRLYEAEVAGRLF